MESLLEELKNNPSARQAFLEKADNYLNDAFSKLTSIFLYPKNTLQEINFPVFKMIIAQMKKRLEELKKEKDN